MLKKDDATLACARGALSPSLRSPSACSRTRLCQQVQPRAASEQPCSQPRRPTERRLRSVLLARNYRHGCSTGSSSPHGHSLSPNNSTFHGQGDCVRNAVRQPSVTSPVRISPHRAGNTPALRPAALLRGQKPRAPATANAASGT